MTTLCVHGFETGDNSDFFTTGGTFSVQSGTVRTGTYALRCNPTTTATGFVALGNSPAVGSSMNATTHYSRFYFRYATKPASGDEPIAVWRKSGGTMHAELRLDSTGVLKTYDVTPTLLNTGTTVLSANTWYRIEVKLVMSASGTFDVKIDGVAEITSGTVTMDANATNYLLLGKVTNRNGNTVDFFYDDTRVDSAAYPGAGQVVALKANGSGNYTQWSTGTGTSYLEVDEVPPDNDTTYIGSSTNTDASTFAMENSSVYSISGTINCVRSVAVCRDEGGASAIKARLRSSTTDSDSSGQNLTTTYSTVSKIYDTDPATGAAWTTSGLDGVEIGVVNGAAVASRCTAVYAYVDYTPPATAPFIAQNYPNPISNAASHERGVWNAYALLNQPPIFTSVVDLPGTRRAATQSFSHSALSVLISGAFAPFYQTDWPNPVVTKKAQGTWYYNSQILFAQIQAPFVQSEWSNPVSRKYPAHTWAYNTQPILALISAPFAQNNWPNPVPRKAQIYSWAQNQSPILSLPVFSPFRQTEWANPKWPKPKERGAVYNAPIVIHLTPSVWTDVPDVSSIWSTASEASTIWSATLHNGCFLLESGDGFILLEDDSDLLLEESTSITQSTTIWTIVYP